MTDRANFTTEMVNASFNSFPEIFDKMRQLSAEYGNLPVENIVSAFGVINSYYTPNPYVQNRRVKGITSLPKLYDKNKVASMLESPNDNEQPLRQLEHALEYTSFPLYHIRTLYQDLLTYHNYIAPTIVDEGNTKDKQFWRDWKLLEKLRMAFDFKSCIHEITGQALQEGKVFYYPRYDIDRAHNKINHAFMQQLPSDWVKIVGFNNKSKYTLAFNMMYFCEAGTTVEQFGDLLIPYLDEFNDVVVPRPQIVGKKVVYASKTGIDVKKAQENRNNAEVYYQNGKWYYWVTLPVDKVFTFEIDDTNRNVISPFAGLFIDLIQLSQLSAIQLELVQNPLVSILTGEIPYFESKDTNTADQYKLSNAGRLLFESLWYQMLQRNNTNGIGLYSAPFHDMKLHTLSEAPSAMDIVSKGYTDTVAKAGLAGIIPVSDNARAGVAQISFQIESRYAQQIYNCAERMMNCIIEKLNLKYNFTFHMFGDLATDEKTQEDCRKAMTLGILPATLVYNALHDRSIFEDITISNALINSGLLNTRVPLKSSYTATDNNGGSQGEKVITTDPEDVGRPTSADGGSSEGHEGDVDGGVAN